MTIYPNGVREWTIFHDWAGASLSLFVLTVWAGPLVVLVGRRGGRLMWQSLEMHW